MSSVLYLCTTAVTTIEKATYQSRNALVEDGPVAGGAPGREEGVVVVLAVGLATALEKTLSAKLLQITKYSLRLGCPTRKLLFGVLGRVNEERRLTLEFLCRTRSGYT